MSDEENLRTRLNQQTARIDWHELALHFARGATVYVAPGLDLVDVACLFAEDSVTEIQVLMSEQRVGAVSEQQAAQWFDGDQQMWAVVVDPWVLVQPLSQH